MQYILSPLYMGVKYAVNENFFKEWTPEMAYVLGYIYADGSLEDASYIRGKYIRISSVDQDSIVRIKKCLNSEHKISELEPYGMGRKIRYLLRIGSHRIYNDLIAYGLSPNKSLTVEFPVIPKKYLCHFVRGYFDGDGCVMFERSKGKKQRLITKRLRIVFTSGSRKFLEGLLTILENNLGLSHGKVYNSHRSLQIRYSTSDSIKLFKSFYGDDLGEMYFKRKYAIFRNYFQANSRRVDVKIHSILKNTK